MTFVYNSDDEVINGLIKSTGTDAKLIPVSAEKALMDGGEGAGLNRENEKNFQYIHITQNLLP